MKPSNELFYLIKSLTKSEKRYFKLASTLQQGQKNYLQLFDAIEEQDEYDEQSIKDRFKGTVFIKHLPSEKNHLYYLILKSLRNFHADSTASSQLQEQIKNIEILFNKALYKECNKLVKKAKKMATDHEEFYFMLELISWEKVLLEEGYARGKFNKKIDDLVAEEQHVLENLRNLAEYQILYSKINYVFRKGGYTRNEKERKIVDEILNYHLIKGKDTALSKKASTACFYIKGLCAWTNRDLDTARDNFLLVIDRFEQNPLLIKELPKRYTRVLNNLLMYYVDRQEFDSFFEYLNKTKSLIKKEGFRSIDMQIRLFSFTRIAELLAYESMGEYDKGEAVIDNILQGIAEFQPKISKEDVIVFYFYISRFYFGSGDFKKSLEYINKVLNDNEANLRQDIFAFSRLINLFIHYELKNYDLLDYIVKSTLRYLKKKNYEYRFELTVIKHIKKLVKVHQYDREVQTTLEEFKKDIEELFNNPYEQVTKEYFDVISWINSKMQGISLAEYKRKSA